MVEKYHYPRDFETNVCAVCGNAENFQVIPGSRTDIYVKKFNIDVVRSHWVICRCCGLVFQNPRPKVRIIQEFYSQNKYFGSDEGRIDSLARESLTKHSEKLQYALEGIVLPQEKYAVEVGAGIGGGVRWMKEKGLNALGIEPDPRISEAGRKGLGVNLITGIFDANIMEENSAAFFYSNHVFEHLYDPNLVVSAMRSALIDGGYVFVCVPTYAKNSSLEAYAWLNLSHNYIFTDKTLGLLFKKFGFEVVKYTYATAANELWMLAKKNKAQPEQVNFNVYRQKDYNEYRYMVLLRSLIFWPLRIGYHVKQVKSAYDSGGARCAVAQLWAALRLPLADSYRTLKSFISHAVK